MHRSCPHLPQPSGIFFSGVAGIDMSGWASSAAPEISDQAGDPGVKQSNFKFFWKQKGKPAPFCKKNKRIASYPSTPSCPQFSDSVSTRNIQNPRSCCILCLKYLSFLIYLETVYFSVIWDFAPPFLSFCSPPWTLSWCPKGRIKCFLINIHIERCICLIYYLSVEHSHLFVCSSGIVLLGRKN